MIDKDKTFKKFGYYYTDLKLKSHKKVYSICDKCGKGRILKFKDYRDLCKSCAGKGRIFTKEHKQKISKSKIGKPRPEEVKRKISKNHKDVSGKNNPMYGMIGENSPMYGKHHSEESKTKMSGVISPSVQIIIN